MAIKLDYVIRETGTNLTRNVTLTLASILTVVVSLTLFGSALLLQRGVQNANDRFKGGIEFIVYMNPDVSPEQKASIEKDLADNPEVKDAKYVDQDDTYEEFKRLFATSPQLMPPPSPCPLGRAASLASGTSPCTTSSSRACPLCGRTVPTPT